MKLFWKIYLLSLFSLVFCSVLLTAIVSYREATNSLARLQADMRVLAITAASQVETGYYDEIWPFEMLSGISREPDFVAWQIVDGSGKVVLSDAPAPMKLAVAATSELIRVEVSENQEFWIAPMRMRDGVHPWQFRLGYTTKAIRAQLGTTIATNALIGLAIAIVFIGTSLLLTHRLLRPLHSLTSAVSELERGNLDVSLPEPGSDEIGLLVTGFSAMVASIQERDAKIQEHLGLLEAARAELETRVEERTHELHVSQTRLIAASRRAGMVEVATNVLHNVGNVLNSVNVSATLVSDRLSGSRVPQVAKVSTMLLEHEPDLGEYLRSDPRGKQVPSYLAELGESLLREREAMINELRSLIQDVDHIKRIVSLQQSYAKLDVDVAEVVAVHEAMEDALRISAGGASETVTIVREYAHTPQVRLDRHKIVHILVNLINNAKQATAGLGAAAQIRLCIATEGDKAIRIDVIDNGIGIAPTNLQRVFNHGFTTKPDGHGFGLHASALAAQQLGGSITAHCDGLGCGSRFTVLIPIQSA